MQTLATSEFYLLVHELSSCICHVIYKQMKEILGKDKKFVINEKPRGKLYTALLIQAV